MDQKTHDNGLRKAMPGEAYVDNALNNADGFNQPFQELVTEYCGGARWSRDELPRKTPQHAQPRMISPLNRPHELEEHIKGALTNGVDSFRIAREVFAELDQG
jgi:4-carboxymuconolactone decarboxylase